MDAIRAITERVSVAQLTGPDITQEQKEVLFKALEKGVEAENVHHVE